MASRDAGLGLRPLLETEIRAHRPQRAVGACPNLHLVPRPLLLEITRRVNRDGLTVAEGAIDTVDDDIPTVSSFEEAVLHGDGIGRFAPFPGLPET